MKLLNVGTMEPVIVVLGDLTTVQVRELGGTILGKNPSKTVSGQVATWISFETFEKVTHARVKLGDLN